MVVYLPFQPSPPTQIKKKYVNKKRSFGLELLDLSSATFHVIFANQDFDRSSKPVVVVLVISLHIYVKLCYVDSMSSKYKAINNHYNLIYLSHALK